jgi:hypothetical protein
MVFVILIPVTILMNVIGMMVIAVMKPVLMNYVNLIFLTVKIPYIHRINLYQFYHLPIGNVDLEYAQERAKVKIVNVDTEVLILIYYLIETNI